MKVYTKVVIDMASGDVLEGASYEYAGPVALCGGKGGGDPPPPPDYSPIAASNAEAARIAQESAREDLAFRKEVYADSKPRQQELQELARKVVNQQYDISEENQGRADEQWKTYQSAFRPAELQMVADSFGSQYLDDADNDRISGLISGRAGIDPAISQDELRRYGLKAEKRAGDEAFSRADASINSTYSQAARQLQRMGGDPAKMARAAGSLAQQQAAMRVGSANTTREGARERMTVLRGGAANFGRNMPNTAGQAYGLATNAGNSAMGNQNASYMSGMPYAQFQAGGYGSGLASAQIQQQGALGLGGLMSRDYGSAMQGYGIQSREASQGMGQWMQMAGTGAGMLSAAGFF